MLPWIAQEHTLRFQFHVFQGSWPYMPRVLGNGIVSETETAIEETGLGLFYSRTHDFSWIKMQL